LGWLEFFKGLVDEALIPEELDDETDVVRRTGSSWVISVSKDIWGGGGRRLDGFLGRGCRCVLRRVLNSSTAGESSSTVFVWDVRLWSSE
jgi:hypothetical protein